MIVAPSHPGYAAGEQMVGVKVPPSLFKGLLLFNIEHRFYGPVEGDIVDNYFGIDDGANIDLSLGYIPMDKTQIDIHRVRNEKEYVVNVARTFYNGKRWKVALGASYFNYKPILASSRSQGLMPYAVVQTPKLWDTQPYINLAYDGYFQSVGAGLGLDISVKDDLSVILEAYTSNQKRGKYAATLIGLRYKTFGHQFTVMLENTPEIGLRRLMTGSTNNSYSLGFSVNRVLDL